MLRRKCSSPSGRLMTWNGLRFDRGRQILDGDRRLEMDDLLVFGLCGRRRLPRSGSAALPSGGHRVAAGGGTAAGSSAVPARDPRDRRQARTACFPAPPRAVRLTVFGFVVDQRNRLALRSASALRAALRGLRPSPVFVAEAALAAREPSAPACRSSGLSCWLGL